MRYSVSIGLGCVVLFGGMTYLQQRGKPDGKSGPAGADKTGPPKVTINEPVTLKAADGGAASDASGQSAVVHAPQQIAPAIPLPTVTAVRQTSASPQRPAASRNPAQELQRIGYQLVRSLKTSAAIPAGGTNANVARWLTGENPDRYPYLDAEFPARAGGKLVDPWGRDYWFHFASARDVSVGSAGPDGRMFNADDVFWHSSPEAGRAVREMNAPEFTGTK
jgi:hypothetical protein